MRFAVFAGLMLMGCVDVNVETCEKVDASYEVFDGEILDGGCGREAGEICCGECNEGLVCAWSRFEDYRCVVEKVDAK